MRRSLFSVVTLAVAALMHIATQPVNEVPEVDDSGYSSSEVLDQDLQGQINGVEWEYALSDADFDVDDNDFSMSIVNDETQEICGFFTATHKLIFSMPNEVGAYDLAFGTATVTLVENLEDETPMNYIAIQGTVEVYSVKDGVIDAGMTVYANENTYVNGLFTATICNSDEMS